MRSPTSRRGFTLIELLVTIAIIAVLIGIIFPGIQAVRAAANRLHCANNIHQVGIAYHMFLDTHRGRTSAFVGDSDWMYQLKPFTEDERVFVCVNADKTVVRIFTIDYGDQKLPYTRTTYSDGTDIITNMRVNLAMLASDLQIPIDKVEIYVPEGPAVIRNLTFLNSWDDASYGIHSKASKLDLTQDSQKVLAVEYAKRVIYPGVGAKNAWPTDAALRHRGILNTLFLDGSVRGMHQGDIDPTVQLSYTEYWQPWNLR